MSTADTTGDTIDRHMQAFNLLTEYVIPSIRAVTDRNVAGVPQVDAVVNAGSLSAGVVAGGWSTIYGRNLSATTRWWNGEDIIGGNLPVQLDGASVAVGGRAAFGRETSTSVSRARQASRGPPGLFAGMTTTPAKPGEVILLYGTGFATAAGGGGVGEIVREATGLPFPPAVSIGGVAAMVEWAGLAQGGAGLYQINVQVPETVGDGDLVVALVYGQAKSPDAYITVRR